jgi:hypothetical protein
VVEDVAGVGGGEGPELRGCAAVAHVEVEEAHNLADLVLGDGVEGLGVGGHRMPVDGDLVEGGLEEVGKIGTASARRERPDRSG